MNGSLDNQHTMEPYNYLNKHFSRWPTKFIQHYITFIRTSFKHACIKSRYLNIMQSTWPLCELERTPTKARTTDAWYSYSKFFMTEIITQIENPLKGLKSLAFCRKTGRLHQNLWEKHYQKYLKYLTSYTANLPKSAKTFKIWLKKALIGCL